MINCFIGKFTNSVGFSAFVGLATYYGIRYVTDLPTSEIDNMHDRDLWGNDEYLLTLKRFVEPNFVDSYLLVYGPEGAGKSAGIMKAVHSWHKEPKKYFVIDINLEKYSSDFNNMGQFANALESDVLSYLELTKPSKGDIKRLADRRGITNKTQNHNSNGFLWWTLWEQITNPVTFAKHILDILLQENHKNLEYGQIILFLLDLAAKDSPIRPVVILHEIQLLRAWSVGSCANLMRALQVMKEGCRLRLILETSNYSFVLAASASDHGAMQKCEVVGWTNPKQTIVDEAKWFSEADFNILVQLLGGNPGLWCKAKRSYNIGVSIKTIEKEMLSECAQMIFNKSLNNESIQLLQSLSQTNWTKRSFECSAAETLPLRSLIQDNILYINNEGHVVPENARLHAAMKQLGYIQ